MHFQGVMRSDLVVLPEPDIDGDQCLSFAEEPFSDEQFAPECSVEPFVATFFRGDPGSIEAAFAPTAAIPSRTAYGTNLRS